MSFNRNRLEFTNPTKRLAFKRSGGICECGRVPVLMQILQGNPCGVRLSVGNTQYDHAIADAFRPDNSLSNCIVLTRTCHALKTDLSDKRAIARAKRREDRQRGIGRTPRQVLLGTVRSGVSRGIGDVPRYRDTGNQWPFGERPNGIIASPVNLDSTVPVIGTDPVLSTK